MIKKINNSNNGNPKASWKAENLGCGGKISSCSWTHDKSSDFSWYPMLTLREAVIFYSQNNSCRPSRTKLKQGALIALMAIKFQFLTVLP